MSIEKELRPYRVLVVDDLDHQRIAIKAAINAAVEGCEFVDAKNVTDAEEVLREKAEPFDLAIIDLKLDEGDKDGVTLLTKNWKGCYTELQMPAVIYTAYPTLQSACAAYEAGASAFISKSDTDSTKKLQKKVKELLEQPDLREVLRRQNEALDEAEEALAQNREEWTKEYGGEFVVVRDGEVIESNNDPHELWKTLNKYSPSERCEMGVIQVPLEEDKNATG